MSSDGLLANLVAFNVGVAIGQLLALSGLLIVMGYWCGTSSFTRRAYFANVALMTAGFMLVGYQMAGFFQQGFYMSSPFQAEWPVSFRSPEAVGVRVGSRRRPRHR